jgi:thioredoxin reductase (NADPH)
VHSYKGGNDLNADTLHDVVIIGSGPAGLTAAIYAARAGLEPTLIEGAPTEGAAGGQLMLTTEVENFPGHPDGIMGPVLIDAMRQQALGFGTKLISETVTEVDFTADAKRVVLGSKEELRANAVIVATGAKALTLGLDTEQRLTGHGVSTCATCDGYFYRDCDVVVVGGGDSALEEALLLAKLGARVKVVHRRDELRASHIMQQRAFESDRISFVWNTIVEDILGADEVGAVVLRDAAGARYEQECAAVFVAIGHTPGTAIFSGQLALDPDGFIMVAPGTETSVPGVFACGDAVDKTYRQAITAAGSGCMAALDASRWLEHAAQVGLTDAAR